MADTHQTQSMKRIEKAVSDFQADRQPRVSLTFCPCCGSDDRDVLYTKKTVTKPLHAVLCKLCGLIYLHEHALEEWGETHGKHGGVGGDEKPLSDQKLRRVFEEYRNYGILTRARLQEKGIPLGPTVLELGSIAGGFGKGFGGETYHAVEEGQGFRDFANQNGVTTFPELSFFENALPLDRYDLILGIRYLNHYHDPKPVLGHIQSYMGPDSVLFLTTKNVFHDVARKGPARAVKADHPLLYSLQSLRYLLESSGFEILYMEDDRITRHYGTLNHCHIACKIAHGSDRAIPGVNVALQAALFAGAVAEYNHKFHLGISE